MMMVNNTVVVESKQYIVINIGKEQYGIDIKYIDNIVRMQRITRVPKAQSYFKGVINLRGEIIPVMSIRLKFGMEAGLETDEFTSKTRIIIIKLEAQSAVGIIVDEVSEVVTLDNDSIDKMGYDANEDKISFVSGVGRHGDSIISILSVTGVILDKDTI